MGGIIVFVTWSAAAEIDLYGAVFSGDPGVAEGAGSEAGTGAGEGVVSSGAWVDSGATGVVDDAATVSF